MDKLDSPEIGELKNVDMSNVQDYPIEADYNYFKFCGFAKVISYLFCVFLLILCFFSAKPITSIAKTEDLSYVDEKYQADFTIDDISPMNKFIHVYSYLPITNKVENVTFKDEITISGALEEQMAFSLSETTNSTTLNVSDGKTDTMHVFTDYKLNYDTLSLALYFESKTEISKNVSIIVEKGNAMYSLESSCVRIIVTLIFAIPFVMSIKEFLARKMMFEQELSFFAICIFMVYADPLCTIGLYYPASFNHTREIVVKDIFMAFFVFFISTLYYLIGLEPGRDKVQRMIFPYAFSVIYLVVVLAIDSTFGGSRVCGNGIDPSYDYSLLTSTSFISFTVFAVVYVYIAISSIVKSQNIDRSRAINYTIVSMPFIIGMEVYYSLLTFTRILYNTAFEEFVPVALLGSCVLLLRRVHMNVKKTDRGLYIKPDVKENEENEDNQFGVDAENVPELPPEDDDDDEQDDEPQDKKE